MKKNIMIKAFIAFVFFSFSTVVFFSLQHSDIYNATLGKISYNYERADHGNGSIIQSQQPYQHIVPNNMYNWDATHYKDIRDHMYDPLTHGHQVRQAFYPLYSILWKITTINSPLIFVFNYLLLVIALLILSNYLGEKNQEDHFIFAISLLLPTTMMFYLPYAESLFVLTFAITIVGLFKRNYWLFFIGAFAFSMTRPACLIYLFALLATDLRYLINHKNFIYFLKESTLKILPFVLGFLAVIALQYVYTGSWTAYWDSISYWPYPKGLFNSIQDWSIEGFGMNVIAICFVAIPAFIYSIVWGIKAFKKNEVVPPSLFSGDHEWIKTYIFNSSILFIAGNLVYTLLTTGNVIHGFARYSMSIPFFYVIWFMLPEKLKQQTNIAKFIAVGGCLASVILFLFFVEYGGNRFQFSFTGLYISLAVLLFFIAAPYLSFKSKLIVFLILLIPAIVWHTYLFNVYLCQAWIYM